MFIQFKLWLEIVEPVKPSSKIFKKKVLKNSGTMLASQVLQFSFKTKLNNVVKVWFEPNGNQSYDFLSVLRFSCRKTDKKQSNIS